MSEGVEGPHRDHRLTERLVIRLTPNEMAWIRAVARGMDPPVSESYVARGCIVGWRQITTHPLIESLKPLTVPLDGAVPPTTNVHKPRRGSGR